MLFFHPSASLNLGFCEALLDDAELRDWKAAHVATRFCQSVEMEIAMVKGKEIKVKQHQL